jgi:hypothetical protein
LPSSIFQGLTPRQEDDMTIEELVPLTNGLSVPASGHTFVCDGARITPAAKDAVDLSFRIAGTDYHPRLRLTRDRLSRATPADFARIVQHVAQHAMCGSH